MSELIHLNIPIDDGHSPLAVLEDPCVIYGLDVRENNLASSIDPPREDRRTATLSIGIGDWLANHVAIRSVRTIRAEMTQGMRLRDAVQSTFFVSLTTLLDRSRLFLVGTLKVGGRHADSLRTFDFRMVSILRICFSRRGRARTLGHVLPPSPPCPTPVRPPPRVKSPRAARAKARR